MSVRTHMETLSEQPLEEWNCRRQLVDLVSTLAASLPDEKQAGDGSILSPTSATHPSAGSLQIDLTHVAESQDVAHMEKMEKY